MMRRTDRAIGSREEIDAIISAAEVCRLALARDNEPYLVPVSFGYDGTAIFIHTAPRGRKIEFFETNSRVCFEIEANVALIEDASEACDWTFTFESVIGYGTITELTNPDAKNHALNQIMHHYSGREWDIPERRTATTRVWRIDIESVTGKRSGEKTKG
jgi:nitroimidazol reductase NimA-like FMN-containing flavoprotein (pyridoxamine 5'-phosphate oxidase superfamily)